MISETSFISIASSSPRTGSFIVHLKWTWHFGQAVAITSAPVAFASRRRSTWISFEKRSQFDHVPPAQQVAPLLTLGPSSSQAARARGWTFTQASKPSVEGILDTVHKEFTHAKASP